MLKDNSAFSLIELLLVVAIIILIAGATIPIYGSLQIASQLNENSTQIIQSIRMAREYSVARVNNSNHGVYFEITAGVDRAILYQGPSYATRDSNYDQILTLDPSLSISTTLNGNEVNFSKGLGIPNNTGTITLSHTVSGNRIIEINGYGKVEKI